MKEYQFNNIMGSWFFEKETEGTYLDMIEALRVVLKELIDSKMLIPTRIDDLDLQLIYKDVNELVEIIERDVVAKKYSDFTIYGDTVIYSKEGEELYSGIFRIDLFDLVRQSFFLETYSDIWLPMIDIDYNLYWNLERYKLNYLSYLFIFR